MTGVRVFIAGMGIIGPLGSGLSATQTALAAGTRGIRPLSLFKTTGQTPLPVGQVPSSLEGSSLPRTHQLARIAADQAMADCRCTPDAVVVGTTTGGMHTTERLLKSNEADPNAYRWHAAGSVAEDLANRFGCYGAVLTVSTACSSGAVAITVAMEMLRSGQARNVLAGGADSLCLLTYHGFKTLQLIDPLGARPLHKNRRGMSVAEGAAMLLLTADEPRHAVAEILGAGLSCDAYHPTAPQPEGMGAYRAMKSALADAGLTAGTIDYISLHGTGTPDNDLAEARAVNRLFADCPPPVSSVKGTTGHPLAAAGAVGAVIAGICISGQMIPANTGTDEPDPALGLTPVMTPRQAPVGAVLSNSFGFGGNNACIVIGSPDIYGRSTVTTTGPMPVEASTCITGAGATADTLRRLKSGESCAGVIDAGHLSGRLPGRVVRRLKYLPRLAMALSDDAHRRWGAAESPRDIFFGTGWGALSETHGFLEELFNTKEMFSSPTDFIGSVHNAPAGQVAMMFGATGLNITMTGGDYSFEQALATASLLRSRSDHTALVVGADEYHEKLSVLFDSSVRASGLPASGGGALLLGSKFSTAAVTIWPSHFARADNRDDIVDELIQRLGGPERIRAAFGVLLAGMPAATKTSGTDQLASFLSQTGFKQAVVDYRKITGEFASASAVAACMAVEWAKVGEIPGPLRGGRKAELAGKGCLVLGFGRNITAMEVMRR